MRSIKKIILSACIVLFAFILVFAALSVPEYRKQQGTTEFGQYTYERVYEIAGEEYRLYASGESNFVYLHDAEGFVLLKDDEGVFYAENANGVPISSGVSLNADGKEIDSVNKMTRYDIDFAKNPELLVDYSTEFDNPVSILSSDIRIPINNLIIYISFKDDSVQTNEGINNFANYSADAKLNGSSDSLRDYFHKITNDNLTVNSHFPKNNSLAYVYKDSRNRSDYHQSGSGKARGEREASLLTNAVNAAKNYFGNLSLYDLDTDADGYIDGVSFLISGSSGSDSGYLLWPHSWNLDYINNEYNGGADASVGGTKIGRYSFNFISDYNNGVVCHEFMHVLGAPDLYQKDGLFTPVGKWDIMQSNQTVPQYPLVYTRKTYSGGIADEQIGTIGHNGIYTLKPVSIADKDEVIAYKIPGKNANEYFMVEYRNPSVSVSYDNALPGAGLIIYRVKTDNKRNADGSSKGNIDSKNQNTDEPYEVYVFRPNVSKSTGSLKSREDVEYAYLSPNNPYFSEVGVSGSAGRYSYDALFYTDGSNSGIVVKTLGISAGSIEFRVSLNTSDNIDNNYFKNKITVSRSELYNGEYSGVRAEISLSEIDLSYLYDLKLSVLDGQGKTLAVNGLNLSKFRQAYNGGERSFASPFVVSDKGAIISCVFERGSFDYSSAPVSLRVDATDADGDNIILYSSVAISSNGLTWDTVKNTATELKPSVYADSRITLGVRNDGTVIASGGRTTGQWAVGSASGIISAAAGTTHTLLLDAALKVSALASSNVYGELSVSSWSNIIAVAAGYYTSYGLTADGKVVAAGLNNYSQLSVSGWSEITAVSAGERHAAGVTADGEVVAAGDNSGGQLNVQEFSNIAAVSAGSTFTACLSTDGSVYVAGTLSNKENVKAWTNIVKIAAGTGFLYGLKEDGTVVSVGLDTSGQCRTSELMDIIDIAAGEYHGAFLRADGVVEFTGAGDAQYGTNSGIDNLIYRTGYITPSSVSLTLGAYELDTGKTTSASASVLPANATYIRILYSSSDTSVAVINPNGVITAVGAGETEITAKLNGFSVTASKTLTVRYDVEPEAMSFADAEKTVKINETVLLALIFSPTNASVNPLALTFESQNPDIAEIDSDGNVRGLKKGTATIKAAYSHGETNLDAYCVINVVTEIESVSILSLPDKTSYLYGESLVLTGARITVKVAGEPDTDVGITPDMVSGYNENKTGKQTLTVLYAGKTAVFDVYVTDYIIEIILASKPKDSFKYGESLSVDGGVLTLKMASGASENKNIVTADVSGYEPYTAGIQTLEINVYSGGKNLSLTYDVTVSDTVNYITVSFIQKTYNYGEPFNLTESVRVIMNSGAERTVEISETAVSGFNNKTIGIHKISVSYTDSVTGEKHTASDNITLNITASYEISGAAAGGKFWFITGTLPVMTVTLVNAFCREELYAGDTDADVWYSVESFNNTQTSDGFAVVCIYAKSNADGQGFRQIGSEPIEVYGVDKYTVKIINNKEIYKYGEAIDIQLQITFTAGGGYIFAPDAGDVTYNPELIGVKQDYTIRFALSTVKAEITIEDYALEIETPLSAEIKLYETFKPTVTAKTASGKTVDVSDAAVIGSYDNGTTGTRGVSVTYTDGFGTVFTLYVSLKVSDAVQTIALKTSPKIQYLYGEAFEPASVYSVTMLSGTTGDLSFNINDFTVSEYNSHKLGTQKVTITYKPLNKAFDFTVTVENYISSISVAASSKSVYVYGEVLNITVNAQYADGSEQKINAPDYATNYSPTKLGEQRLSVSYKQFLIYFTVRVDDAPSKAELISTPTYTTFKYGEGFKCFGGEIRVTYLSGDVKSFKSNADITAAFKVTYNPTKVGAQTVTLTIGTKSVGYQVTVSALNKESDLFTLAASENVKNISANGKYCILLETSFNKDDLLPLVTAAEYLSVVFKNQAGAVLAADTLLQSGMFLHLINSDGVTVRSYIIYLRGDADMNGIFDESDISEFAKQYLENSALTDIADYDGNGEFTLTDLVNWARKASGKGENPVNTAAKRFITDIKPPKKENGEEEENDEKV